MEYQDYSVNVAQFWQDRVNDESGHGENGRENKRGRVNIRLMQFLAQVASNNICNPIRCIK